MFSSDSATKEAVNNVLLKDIKPGDIVRLEIVELIDVMILFKDGSNKPPEPSGFIATKEFRAFRGEVNQIRADEVSIIQQIPTQPATFYKRINNDSDRVYQVLSINKEHCFVKLYDFKSTNSLYSTFSIYYYADFPVGEREYHVLNFKKL